MKKIVWIIFFLLILFANVIAIYLDNEILRLVSKPLLMPVLAIYILLQTKKSNYNLKAWVLLALLFSWAGDMLLLFEEAKAIFFILGLSAFLIALFFYIVFFNNIRVRENIRGNYLFFLLVIIYYSVLTNVLAPHLGKMELPVRIYGVVLSFMLMLAMHTILGKKKRTASWIMIGAILFVISDSLLAFNKFYTAFNYADIVVMLTYGLAQLFIIEGAIRYINSQNIIGTI